MSLLYIYICTYMDITPETSIYTYIYTHTHTYFSFILIFYSKYSIPTKFRQEIYLGLLFERLPRGSNHLVTKSCLLGVLTAFEGKKEVVIVTLAHSLTFGWRFTAFCILESSLLHLYLGTVAKEGRS